MFNKRLTYMISYHEDCLLSPGINPVFNFWRSKLTASGLWGKNTVLGVVDFCPISFIISKYCVTKRMSITSCALAPLTLLEKSLTLSRRPSTTALRCRAWRVMGKYIFLCQRNVQNGSCKQAYHSKSGEVFTLCLCFGSFNLKNLFRLGFFSERFSAARFR